MQAGVIERVIRYSRQWLAAWPLLLLALLASLVELLGGGPDSPLRYLRVAVQDGEWWRLLSANLVHLGGQHLLLNIAGLALVLLLFGRGLRSMQWLGLLLAAALVQAAGFLWLEPQLEWYVGMSGLLHGLIIGGALLDLTFPCRERNILLLLIGAKLAWEQVHGAVPFTAAAAGGPVVVDAHLYGAIGGFAAAVAFLLRDRRRSRL